LIIDCHVSATEEILLFSVVVTKIVVTVLQCSTVCCLYNIRHIDCVQNSLCTELSILAITLLVLFQIYAFWFIERERERERAMQVNYLNNLYYIFGRFWLIKFVAIDLLVIAIQYLIQ